MGLFGPMKGRSDYGRPPPAPPTPPRPKDFQAVEAPKPRPQIYEDMQWEHVLNLAEAMVDDDNITLAQMLNHYRHANESCELLKRCAEAAFYLSKDKESFQKWVKMYLEPFK